MMTKEEFDDAFLHRRCCVRALTREQWKEVNRYAVKQLGLFRSQYYFSHDCDEFPLVYCRGKYVGAIARLLSRSQIAVSFNEFCAITQETTEEDLPCGSLDGIL